MHSKLIPARLTLMELSVLRMPLVLRTAFIVFILSLVFAATPASAQTASARARKHHAASHSTHARSHVATTRSARTSARSRAHRSTQSVSSRRHTYRRPVRVIRASTTYRRRHIAPGAAAVNGAADSSEAADDSSASFKSAAPAPKTSQVAGNTSDDASVSEPNTPTAEDAADHIAADHTQHLSARLSPAPFAPIATPSINAAATGLPMRNSTIVAMAPLRGSLESLMRQNAKTDADNLERIQDDADLHSRIINGSLVPVPVSSGLTVNDNLPTDRRYCRPWTAKFLSDLARAHESQFHHSFEVSSAVRTVEFQKRLMRTNGNAAPAEGDIASPHLTGATIDIAKSGLTRSELYWMRDRLNELQNQGKIDVEEEFHQSCFHITVYKSYVGAGPAHKPHHAAPTTAPDNETAPAVAVDSPATGS